MVHSQLPVPSLLGLFGALLMLFPELLMGMPISDLVISHPWVRAPLAFAVEKYNKDRDDSANYFKMLRLLKAQLKATHPTEYHLTVELVITACRKRAGKKKTYKKIQRCDQLPGYQEKPTCQFIVQSRSVPFEMNLLFTDCI